MSMLEFTSPLQIIKGKQNDIVLFETQETTPFDYTLTVKDLDDNVLAGPFDFNLTRNGTIYWFITLSAAFGFSTTKTYYEIIISDGLTNAFIDERYILYLTDELDFESYILRGLGLSGQNVRRFNHVWARGLLQSFDIKLYSNANDLSAAIAGTSDNFFAHYQVTITYDANYNRTKIESIKV